MSEEMNTAEVYEVDKLTLLNCAEIHLKKEPSGYLTLEYGGKTYRKIDLPDRRSQSSPLSTEALQLTGKKILR